METRRRDVGVGNAVCIADCVVDRPGMVTVSELTGIGAVSRVVVFKSDSVIVTDDTSWDEIVCATVRQGAAWLIPHDGAFVALGWVVVDAMYRMVGDGVSGKREDISVLFW